MNAVMEDKVQVTDESLVLEELNKKLNFTVSKQPLYRKAKDGTLIQSERRSLVRDDDSTEVTTCTEDYAVAQMPDTILKNTRTLIEEQGWKLPPSRRSRRDAIRVERGGLRAYVELIHPEVQVNVGKDNVYARFVQVNSFDTTTMLGATAGGFVQICANGLHAEAEFMGVKGYKHISGINRGIDEIRRMADKFLENYETISKGWEMLRNTKPSATRGLAAVEAVSARSVNTIMDRMHGTPESGWDWFQGITEYLTYDFNGAQSLFNSKQVKAQKILLGEDKKTDKEYNLLSLKRDAHFGLDDKFADRLGLLTI